MDLSSVLSSVPADDKIILLGDFNACVGCDYGRWKGVLDKHGVGRMNSNGLLLLRKYTEFNLILTNSMFRMANKHMNTWMHPR